ncbi:MAG TPA: hypothetical protein VLE53_04350 [Gemmatimonadaceae bacterium]|nr:hypothetical protein [Gemmatimonadaceae bacterium]
MTVAPLLEHLRRDAEAEAAQRLADARAAAAALASALDARLTSHRAAALAAAQREIVHETDARRDAARQRAAATTLGARQRFVTRVLDAVLAAAATRTADPSLVAWMASRFETAVECFPPGTIRARTPPALAPALRSLAQRQGTPLELREDDTLSPGFVLERPDGALRVDATLESLLQWERSRLAIWLMRTAAADDQP